MSGSDRGASGGYAPKEADVNRPPRVGKDLQEIKSLNSICRQAAKRFRSKWARTELGVLFFSLSHQV